MKFGSRYTIPERVFYPEVFSCNKQGRKGAVSVSYFRRDSDPHPEARNLL